MAQKDFYTRVGEALYCTELPQKLNLVDELYEDLLAGKITPYQDDDLREILPAGRPERPELVAPQEVPRRKLGSKEGVLALVHAICHIEFNAINLGLDAAYRFRNMPLDFYKDWLLVAKEETKHFRMLSEHLESEGSFYGAFAAHNGLWDSAERTAHDTLVRMALVPRVLEARGLDVTPGIIHRLHEVGESRVVELLKIILHEEEGHVEIGNRWYRYLCEKRGIEEIPTALNLLKEYGQMIRAPLNEEARLRSGFTKEELEVYFESFGSHVKFSHLATKFILESLEKAVFIGISGLTLTEEEKAWLVNPLVGGVILFTRNYQDKAQLKALTSEIRRVNPSLLISVDHEGGRVQRFREGFTKIPPMREFGELYDKSPGEALEAAKNAGITIGKELNEVGIDFSYTPVCDIDYGVNPAIGDRAFHGDPEVVVKLVTALYSGLKEGGTIGIAKHFPGHGFINIDTHLAVATDLRTLEALEDADLKPFKALIAAGVEGVMPAHIIYPAMDAEHTAVTSPKWMAYLRETLQFSGAIMSDDLDMKGAEHLGTVKEKVGACFNAGINIVLICNDMDAIRELFAK